MKGAMTTTWFVRTMAVAVFCLGMQACDTKPPAPTRSAPAQGRKTLLMHYMPWYETPATRGRWGTHWTGGGAPRHDPSLTDTNGLPDIWSRYHPLIGLYDSTDPEVLECHLLQMKLAGIDGVIVDWYGIHKAADYPEIHKATCDMFAATGKYGMSFAACYEDRSIKLLVEWGQLSSDKAPAHLTETLQWMDSEWFSKPQYFRYHGHPLMLNFGPIYLTTPAVWKTAMDSVSDRPVLYGLHHLWKQAAGAGGFTWVHRDPWDGSQDSAIVHRRINEVFTYFSTNATEVIVSAFPGYDDVYSQGNKRLEYRNGETLRETLAVGMEGPWPIIQLVTWNDYGEGTMIEPSHEFGYTFLEIIQGARKRELGGAFIYTPDDLRLPARLLALRKNGNVSPKVLDRIARCLSEGDCTKARRDVERQEQKLKGT